VLTAVLVVAGYLSGSITWGYWLVRVFRHEDVRTKGSGNIGASNVWRTFGRKYGLPVVLLDTAKGFAPALVGTLVHGHLAGVIAGGAAMLGHWRPLFLRFAKGGKMVATTGGAFLGVAPIVGGLGAAVWLIVFGLTRFASIASILAALSLPALAAALGYGWPVIVFGGGAAAGVIVLHRSNIRRLFAGTESRFSRKRKVVSA
jgi:glycerol-3-phosphate acyltransferase PlsY